MFLTVAVAVIAIWCLKTFLEWKRDTYDPVKKLNCIGYPVIGSSHKLIRLPKAEVFKTICKINTENAPLFRDWIGFTPLIHIVKPEYVEIITNNTIQIDKGFLNDYFRPWLGDSLLMSSGSKWHQQRKLITPTFHFKILENFMDVFAEKAEILLQNLDAKADGKFFNIYPEITHCALDIICETAIGVQINAMSKDENEYAKAVYDISSLIIQRAMKPFLSDYMYSFLPESRRYNEVLSTLHGFTKNVISERKAILNSKTKGGSSENITDDDVLGKKKRTSFLDLLLEVSDDGKVLTDNDIREQVDTLLFAGHDTITSNVCWTLFLLGNHPEVQQKVYEEVHHILENKDAPSSISEINQMKYLECVIKEVLRMYPSVAAILRKLKKETEMGGCKIPAGSQVLIHIYEMHNSPEYFPDPGKFIPERFLSENSVKRHPYAYIPFSAGPRNCIGQKFAMQEEKTVLASIINRYKVIAMEKPEEIVIAPDVILRPMNGVILTLERRK